MSHNHPSARAEPSAAERKKTKFLQNALDMEEERELDHIIVGDAAPLSMAEYGWL